MFILLDTNILFSALIFQGNEREILRRIIKEKHTLVLTDSILAEIEGLIERKMVRSDKRHARDYIQWLSTRKAVFVKYHELYKSLLDKAFLYINKKDAPILAAGLQEEIDALVSGDKDFIKNPKLATLRKKKIFTTREMLERL